jgi:hypothetical protein
MMKILVHLVSEFFLELFICLFLQYRMTFEFTNFTIQDV